MAIVVNATLTIKSPAFLHNGIIPAEYSCDGENINPEITISDIPKDTKTLALVMDDTDAQSGVFVHWIMWNIPPREKIIANSSPGAQGRNSQQQNKYMGPCPPRGTPHHYHFRIYALDTALDLPVNTEKNALLSALEGHILASGELIGLYKKL